MAIKPVEYVKDSSTAGFAVAGDEKTITKTNANTIYKDVEQGNTEDLDSAQERYLENYVDEDSLEYSDDERKNVGANQIDTDDTENTNGLGTAGSTALSGAGIATSTAVAGTIDAGAEAIETYSKLSDDAAKTAKAPWMAIAAGAIDLAVGVAALIAVNVFDDQYGARMGQKDSAGDTNNIIQQYYDQMGSDMDTMTEDSEKYAELSETKLTADVDRITQIGALKAQMAVYAAQGNTEMVEQLQGQIDALTEEGEDDTTGDEISNLQASLEEYSGNNAEAVGISESGATVAEFLGDGKQMGALAIVNTAILLVSGILMLGSVVKAAKAAAGVPWPGNIAAGIVAVAGAIMMVAGNVMVLAAAAKMAGKAKDEFKCADEGSNMQDNVNTLNENIEAQGGFVETTGANYAEIATQNAETTAKTQEGVDKANANLPQPTPTPAPTAGNGGVTNPPDEEPEPQVA